MPSRSQARYVHGSNAAADDPLVWYTGTGSTTKRWLHADHLGSIVGVTTNSGASFAKNAYDEYGIPGAANQGRFQYTGQAWIGELGMYYYKARIYSPTLGRFLQTDPIGYEGGGNLYAYVVNDPVNASDYSGKYGELIWTSPTAVMLVIPYSVNVATGAEPGFTNAGLEAQVAHDFSGTVNFRGKEVTITAQAVARDPSAGKTNVINVIPTTKDVTTSGRAETNRVGGDSITVGSSDGQVTATHELGHAVGAGDQYPGGRGVDGSDSQRMPGPDSRMRDLGVNGLNQQSKQEILRSDANKNVCPAGVPAPNGGC